MHWFGPKQYLLIWEGEYLGPEPPAVYDNPDKPTEYARIQDSKFVEDITADFKQFVSRPLPWDVAYKKNDPVGVMTGLMGMGSESIPNGMDKALYTSQAGEQTQVGAREGEQARIVTSQVGDKFCRNCGTKLCQGWKSLSE